MKFGMFYEHQLPQPWGEDSERRLYPGCAGAGRARRQTRHRLRVGGRAPLPGGIFALLRAGDLPRRLLAAHAAHPARPRHRADAAEIQSSRARGGAHRDARSGVERTRRLGYRRIGHRAGDGGLRHPARGKERDVARGDRTGRQHAGDASVSRLPRQRISTCRAATWCRSRCRSRIRRCGWRVPSARPSIARRVPAWAR